MIDKPDLVALARTVEKLERRRIKLSRLLSILDTEIVIATAALHAASEQGGSDA